MTRPGLRRSIPHGLVALSLSLVALVSGLALVPPADVVADTPGGQSSSYTVPPRDVNNCALYSPLFNNDVSGMTSTLAILHTADSATVLTIRTQRLGGGTLISRTMSMGAHEMNVLSPSDIGVPANFSGSISVVVEGAVAGTLTPTVTATRTPIPASTVIPIATATVLPGTPLPPTLVPTAAPPTTTAVPIPTISNTPASCGISGVVFHDQNGDRSAVEMFRQTDSQNRPQEDFFIPVFRNNDNGFNTNLVIQNTDRNADQTATLTFRQDSTGMRVDRAVTIRSESSTAVDNTSAPTGASTVEIDGPSGSLLLATAYHTGPGGMAAAVNGVGRGADRISVPLLYRRAGNENAYSSIIRIMKVRPGGVTPKLTLWDRDTGAQIGPITATRADGSDVVLRENEGFTMDLNQLSQLQDGKIYSARVDSDDRQEIAAVAAHLNTRRATIGGYSGVSEALTDRILHAPYVIKGTDNLNSGIQLRNYSGTDASVTIRFLNLLGIRIATEALTVPSFDSRTVYLPTIADLPNGVYTAEITSSSPIAAVVNVVRYR